MSTIRTLLLAAIRNALLVWGVLQLSLCLILGRENSQSLLLAYCFGAGLILLHFAVRASRKQVFRIS